MFKNSKTLFTIEIFVCDDAQLIKYDSTGSCVKIMLLVCFLNPFPDDKTMIHPPIAELTPTNFAKYIVDYK